MWPHPRPSFKTPQWLPCSIRWRSSLCKQGSWVWGSEGLSPPVSAALPHPASPFRLCTWALQIFCATSDFPEALHKALQFLPTERGPSVPSDQRSLLPPARLHCALSRLLLQDTWCCQVQELENWRAVTVSPSCVPCMPSKMQTQPAVRVRDVCTRGAIPGSL